MHSVIHIIILHCLEKSKSNRVILELSLMCFLNANYFQVSVDILPIIFQGNSAFTNMKPYFAFGESSLFSLLLQRNTYFCI